MNTSDLSKKGFKKWIPFNIPNKDCLLKQLKKYRFPYGVYVIATKKPFGRFIGKSDIVYIGSTRRKNGGLRSRIRQYFNPGKTQWTNKRIYKLLTNNNNLQISVVSKKYPQKARELEKKLLTRYSNFNQHGELPPFNRSGFK